MNTIKKEESKAIEDFVFQHVVESWIQGYPMKTDHGYIKAIKVKDFFKQSGKFEFLKKTDFEVKKQILKEIKGFPMEDQIKNDLKNNINYFRNTFYWFTSSLV